MGTNVHAIELLLQFGVFRRYHESVFFTFLQSVPVHLHFRFKAKLYGVQQVFHFSQTMVANTNDERQKNILKATEKKTRN
jgi:hypothetical protein